MKSKVSPSYRLILLALLPFAPVVALGNDVNGDGRFDAADILASALELAAGVDPSRVEILDANEDGFANDADTEFIAQTMAGQWERPPVALFISNPPAQNVYTSSREIQIAGTVGESSDVTIGSATLTNIAGEFSRTVSLSEGMNILDIRAVPAGATVPASFQSRTAILDTVPPVVGIYNPDGSSALSDTTVEFTGYVEDSSPVTVSVSTALGAFPAKVDGSGYWSATVQMEKGIGEATVTATDAAGLQTNISTRLRVFLSAEQDVVSTDGGSLLLPEGALGDEEMTVRLFDVPTDELKSIVGGNLIPTMPPGANGFEDLPVGTIIMPSGLMLEVENGPENGLPIFQRDVEIALPNVTGADNTMPLWIFQIQPDIDGDGEAQLTVVSRAKVSDDGTMIIPIVDGVSELDETLPGFMNPDNRRFEEQDLDQVDAARAVKDLRSRLRGEKAPARSGRNVASARGKMGPDTIAATTRAVPLAAPPAPDSSMDGIVRRSDKTTKGGPFRLDVDNFEDGDLLNLLTPPGTTFAAETGSESHPTDPILPRPVERLDLPGNGNPPTALPNGVNGGIALSGRFGNDQPAGLAECVTTLYGRDVGLDLSGVDNLQLEFDFKTDKTGPIYEVTLEDRNGPGRWITIEESSLWDGIEIPAGMFAVNLGDLRRIHWRCRGDAGTEMDFHMDNPRFTGSNDTNPPPPTPTMVVTITDPTPPPPTPTGTTAPTLTITPTATAPPTMTATRTSPPPPTTIVFTETTPVPTADPIDPEDPGNSQEKTQVTFFCCAASALIPYTGKTACEDDENVNHDLLRQCLAEEQARYVACEQNLNRLLNELNGSVDTMFAGYDDLFGVVTLPDGTRVPTIVGGSLFRSITVAGSGPSANLTKSLLETAADGLKDGATLRAAINSQNESQINAAIATLSQDSVNAFVNGYLSQVTDANRKTLGVRGGFDKGWALTNAAANLYKVYGSMKGLINGLVFSDALNEEIAFEMQQCTDRFNRLRDLKNCRKGSRAWAQCGLNGEEKLGGKTPLQFFARIEERAAEIRSAGAEVREGLGDLQSHVETFGSAVELLRTATTDSIAVEDASIPLSARRAAAIRVVDRFELHHSALYTMLVESERLAPALGQAMKTVELVELMNEQAEDIGTALEFLNDEVDAMNEGDEGILVKPMGQPESSKGISGKGGKFVGYRFARAGRNPEGVTFEGGSTSFEAQAEGSLLSGETSATVPTLTFEFTPFSTLEFDQVVHVGAITVGLDENDDAGVPPVVELTNPSGNIRLPPGVPFLARAHASDDTLVYSTRFLLDGKEGEPLGTTDFKGNSAPVEFSAYYLVPELDKTRGAGNFSVVAQAIDIGGNIGESSTAMIEVDPEAPLLATISPESAIAYLDGPAINFSATITASGGSVPAPVWFVDGTIGGSSRTGTISQSGVYTPPVDLATLTETFEIQMVSLSNPELIGIATVQVQAASLPIAIASVLNNIVPDDRTGRAAAPPVSVMGLFLPSDSDGLGTAAPVSLLNAILPSSRTGTENAAPVSVNLP